MKRLISALVLGLLLAPVVAQTTAQTATLPKAGTYEVVSFSATGQGTIVCLVKITPKDAGVEGELLTTAPAQRGVTLAGVTLSGDTLRVNLKRAAVDLVFEGRVPQADAESVRGSIVSDGRVTAARVAITDKTELTADNISAQAADLAPLRQGPARLRQATQNKAEVDQVQGWVDEMTKAAHPYGARFENEVTAQVAELLAPQSAYAAVALDYAQRAEKALTGRDSLDHQARVAKALVTSLKSAGRIAEAAPVEARLDKLETEIDREYLATVPPFKPTAFTGRRSQSDRAAVMELFTGAQCPPCVAADVAFDALEKTYKHTDVVLIQYHLHIPGPDPMTNATTEARAKYYGVSSTPSTFFNGERKASGGGAMAAAQNKYNQYRGVLDELLEKPAEAAVKLDAVRQGDTVTVKADVSNVTDPGEGKKLRFVVVEESIRFTGVNKLRFHHMVVRAMPGGVDGIALTEKEGKHSASVKLDDLRQELTKYLDDYALTKRPFPQPERPMAFKNLKAIALVQDEKSKEILQSVIVDVQ